MATKPSNSVLWLVQLALLTAIVVVLQMLSAFIKFGPFQITLALVPIAIGAAVLGVWEGGWLGFVFGLVVLLNGDAAPFLAFHAPGTILTVLLKGMGAGLAAGIVYKMLSKKNKTAAAIASSIAAPIVNTGIFILGCFIFFIPLLTEWAGGENVTSFLLLTVIGLNFVVEFATVVILSGVIVRIINIWKKA